MGPVVERKRAFSKKVNTYKCYLKASINLPAFIFLKILKTATLTPIGSGKKKRPYQINDKAFFGIRGDQRITLVNVLSEMGISSGFLFMP